MSVSGYPAREIIVDIPALKIVTVMRLLIVKKRAFSVGSTSFAGSEGKSDYQTIFGLVCGLAVSVDRALVPASRGRRRVKCVS
jgi:hypothetical protein